ncbi:histidine kinase [Cupriavidus oxalaticus]|uniref:trifunctional serine/threonine-protein kinase/ATP-binding protein/sensor histidine kinase n=1 Tax=Cupriavidus oxalaticus TaxID=96344 RepID=UPI003F739E0A
MTDKPALQVPLRLVGRTREMALLFDALGRVCQSGKSELVLLAGAAGAGKSALAHAFSRQAAAQTGARIAGGKSDQLQLDIPYAPVAQAILALTLGLLDAPPATLAPLRERWLGMLAGQGRVVAELVPETEQVLGRTPPLANVPAPQAQARAHGALLATFSAFAAPGMPLVLFFDDLQWADAFTVALLEAFMVQRPGRILLIAAYRDHGQDVEQRFSWLLHANRSGALALTRIAVRPLAPDHLAELVGAVLDEPPARIAALAHAVHDRTAGNPFFSCQLLRTLVDDGVLTRQAGGTGWDWRADDVDGQHYPGSIVDLMIRRFARLPRAGTELLQQLACVGLRCDAGLLARVANVSAAQLASRLQPLVEAGLLVQAPCGYAFQHDRVLESAYSMIEPHARPAEHARIAQIMIEHWRGALADHAFEICNQIERVAVRASQALPMPQREAFVEVLLVAGRRAWRSGAIGQALHYMDTAHALMQPDWWNAHYALAYAVDLLHCECLLAQARLDAASDGIDMLLARAQNALDQGAAYRLRASLQTARSDYEGAIDAALSGLALLDVHLERAPSAQRMREAYDAAHAALGTRPIASLASLPATGDPRIHAVMGLLSTLISSLSVRDGISFLHVAKMVELTLDHGATPESPYGLSWFGVFIASLYEAYEDGLAYGQAAMALIDHHGYEAGRIATLVAVGRVSAWTRPLSYALGHAQQAVALGRASGDIGMACHACNHIASDLLVMGEQLCLVAEEIARGLALTRQLRHRDIELILHSQLHFVQRLRVGGERGERGERGEGSESSGWQEEAARCGTAAQRLARSNSLPTRFRIYLYDGMAAVFLGQWAQAVHNLRQAEKLIWSAPAHINVADCRLFLSLALAHAQAPQAAAEIAAHRACFARWAALNPLTFRSKLLLADAALAQAEGEPLRALACLEQSGEAAAAGFVHEQALAHELAGMLCARHGLHTAARQHLAVARACYRRWGAEHKATLLAVQYPQLDAPAAGDTPVPSMPPIAGWELGRQAARALSSEIVMDRLVESLLSTVILHAGARYGLLVLMRDGEPMIEASGRVLDGKVTVALGSAPPTEHALPLAVLNSVLRMRQTLVLADAMVDAPSIRTKAATGSGVRSVLCLPLVRGHSLIGAVYLENNNAPGVFGANHVAELEMLAPQVAIALETARLYEQLIGENNRRVAAEIGLRDARAELARTSHLTVMGTLAASIGHEVNQPLTAIVATVDASVRWLKRPQPELGEALEGFAFIRQHALRASDIVRALRALARQAPAALVPLSPDEVLREVLVMVRPELDAHNVRAVTRLAAGATQVEADRVQLQQVVLNLVTNALDAMAGTPAEQRELLVASYREQEEQEMVVVSVQDHGAGIAEDVLPRVFDAFFTTKDDGMGMGLAICRSIVEAHGGTLVARRRRSGGTEFMFRLPVFDPAASAGPAAAHEP